MRYDFFMRLDEGFADFFLSGDLVHRVDPADDDARGHGRAKQIPEALHPPDVLCDNASKEMPLRASDLVNLKDAFSTTSFGHESPRN
jgi:hypothetical protein